MGQTAEHSQSPKMTAQISSLCRPIFPDSEPAYDLGQFFPRVVQRERERAPWSQMIG